MLTKTRQHWDRQRDKGQHLARQAAELRQLLPAAAVVEAAAGAAAPAEQQAVAPAVAAAAPAAAAAAGAPRPSPDVIDLTAADSEVIDLT